MPFSDFSSSSVIPVMYDKNAGYSGRVHGEIKLKNPAPKAKNTLISDPIFFNRSLQLLHSSYQKKAKKRPFCL